MAKAKQGVVKPRIFISWAGPHARAAAEALSEELEGMFEKLGIEAETLFSSVALQAGADWRRQLHRDLQQAVVGIAVIDPYALRSTWLPFESGFIVAKGEDESPALFPLVLADDPKLLESTPFSLLHCVPLAVGPFDAMLKAVFEATDANVAQGKRRKLASSFHDAVREAWQAERERRSPECNGLLALLGRIVDEYAAFGLVDDRTASEIRHLLGASRESHFPGVQQTSLFRELAEIAELFDECAREEDRPFGDIATDWTLRALVHDYKAGLRDVASGELPLRHHPVVRAFWIESVFGRADHSIWTTYVDKIGATMGGENDRQLLAAQSAAIARKVEVTRLFVHPVHMNEAEILERRAVMRAQLEVGVKIQTVDDNVFGENAAAHKWVGNVGSRDFMIIDGSLLYLTHLLKDRQEAAEAVLISGQRQPERLVAAERFRDELVAHANEITVDNVDEFPSAPPPRRRRTKKKRT
jgi:hypothetical protein